MWCQFYSNSMDYVTPNQHYLWCDSNFKYISEDIPICSVYQHHVSYSDSMDGVMSTA
jgi:hypothetical protein